MASLEFNQVCLQLPDENKAQGYSDPSAIEWLKGFEQDGKDLFPRIPFPGRSPGSDLVEHICWDKITQQCAGAKHYQQADMIVSTGEVRLETMQRLS